METKELVGKILKDFSMGTKLGTQDAYSSIKDWISTQSPILDYIIGGKGIPVGRLTEINGLISTGKSLLCQHIIAENQRRGGISILVDSESAYDARFAERIGVNLDELVILQPDSLEDMFEEVNEIIDKVRAEDSNIPLLIVIDSVSALAPKGEVESDFGQAQIGLAARIISRAMRKLTTKIAAENVTLVLVTHLKYKIGGISFAGPQTVATGGLALGYHATLRLKLENVAKIRKSNKIVGIQTRVTTVKSKITSPYQSCYLYIYFDKGIDKDRAYIDAAEELGIIKKKGGWYSIEDEKFHVADFKKVDEKYKIREKVDKEIYGEKDEK